MELSINTVMGELERVYEQKKTLEDQLTSVNEYEQSLRQKMMEIMGTNGIKSVSSENNKIMAVQVTRKDYKVVDEPSVRTFLQTQGALEECLRLDLPSVKRFAKTQEVPGIEVVESTNLTIRPIAEKVERIEPEESVRDFHKRMQGGQE